MTELSELHHTYYGVVRRAMIYNCENPMSPLWDRFGAKGIKVCERWRNRKGLIEFKNDILEGIGPRPSLDHGLTRIDLTGEWEPSNVVWMTNAERQARRRIKISLGEAASST